MNNPAIALVVPSLNGQVDALLASVARQTVSPAEIEVVRGVEPSGRARNLGAARTSAPLVVFVDDDAVLGGDDTLANLVAPLADPTVGAAGASKLVPSDSSWFQRRVARQVPRIEHPVVDRLTESNVPLDRFGYSDVTTTCCAMRREVYEACGGFDQGLVRGVDTEFFYRVCRAGYRLVLAPRTWVDHPAPKDLDTLLAKHFLYGTGYAQDVRRHPERAAGRHLSTPVHAAAYVVLRTAFLVPHALVPYSHSTRSWRPGFKPLGALASYAAALGYVYGWYGGGDATSTAGPPADATR
ncbi:MAG: glycosyltransferase [Actinomycetota bacterium]|nr:glycosyltransferase [Actinomycetota bacterium]